MRSSPHTAIPAWDQREGQGIRCRWHTSVTVGLRCQHREGTRMQQGPVPQNTKKQAWGKPAPCQSHNTWQSQPWLTWGHTSSVPCTAALLCLFCPRLKHLYPLVLPSCSSKHCSELCTAPRCPVSGSCPKHCCPAPTATTGQAPTSDNAHNSCCLLMSRQ